MSESIWLLGFLGIFIIGVILVDPIYKWNYWRKYKKLDNWIK